MDKAAWYSQFKSIALLVAAVLICLAPFLSKPFHIDDPLSVWVAKQVTAHPANPFGFKVNWWSVETTMAEAVPNPPLNSYYMALAARILGWREIAVHFAFLLPAIAAILGTWTIARRVCGVCGSPLAAALATLATPVFVVSGTTVMCDMLLLAFWVWAIAFWLQGYDEKKRWPLVLSAILIAAASLTKYFGISLVPLLVAYSIMRDRRFSRTNFYLLIPVAVMLGYELVTRRLYGRAMFSAATFYQIHVHASEGHSHVRQMLTGLAFTGGCFPVVAFYLPALCSKKAAAIWLGFAGSLFPICFYEFVAQVGSRHSALAVAAQGCLFAAAGTGILALAVADLWKNRDATAILLFCWTIGTFAFAVLLNWSVTARTLLPAAPAVGILILRRAEIKAKNTGGSRRLLWPIVPAATLALLVSVADFSLAWTAQIASEQLRARFVGASGNVWFEGHWGFQYYMQLWGARPMAFNAFEGRVGDWIVIPHFNTNLCPLDPQMTGDPVQGRLQPCRFLSTMRPDIGAGFYSSVFGPLPWAFGAVAPEVYDVAQIVR